MSPLSNAFLEPDKLNRMEPFYPLHAYICDECFLVQLEVFETPEQIFTAGYPYLSSYSETWLAHARLYAEQMVQRFSLTPGSQVIEIASNDGCVLEYFRRKSVPVLGIEPAKNVAEVAIGRGIPTITRFFGVTLARELAAKGVVADLLFGNNVLAHVPDLKNFVQGLKVLLKPDGVLTMEFPHLQQLIEGNQFDTIYHEHFSYFSFLVVQRIFASCGLHIFDVDELPIHGGSLRIYGCHTEKEVATSPKVSALALRERKLGFDRQSPYDRFSRRVQKTKWRIVEFMIQAKHQGKVLAGYGAPAKGNTLLNYCGVRSDLLEFTVDRNPQKQGKFLPGSHIPIYPVERIDEVKPDYLFILPWNIKDEIIEQMAHIRLWGAQFVVPIPDLEIVR
jgi:hypothetical protein